MENVGMFYGYSEFSKAIWYISWPFGNLVVVWYIFPRFGILYIWQPCVERPSRSYKSSSNIF
jgi:hypothetical protein